MPCETMSAWVMRNICVSEAFLVNKRVNWVIIREVGINVSFFVDSLRPIQVRLG